MSRKYLLVAGIVVGLVLLLTGSISKTTDAAEPRRPGGITISPVFQDIVLDPTKAAETFDFSVTNNTDEPHEFSLSVVDFGSLDESGGVLFIGEAEKQLDYRYGLSAWASLERDRIVVEPKATVKVPVTVTNRESLSPGGHYGAVLLTPAATGDRPTRVQINQVLSSLLFVKKQGGEIYNFGLRSFDVKTHVFKSPSAVEMRFQNAGNVHVIPRGTVTVTDPLGRVVQKGIINADSAIILPETFRQVRSPLEAVGTAWVPGKYTMTMSYRFDGQIRTETRELTFVYVNGWYIIAAVLLLAGLAVMIINRKFRRIALKTAARPFKIAKKAIKKW